MSFRCACGRALDLPGAGDVECPGCGAVYAPRPGWHAARCECGTVAFATPAQRGTSIPCAGCFLRVAVPADAPPAPPALKSPPRPRPKPALSSEFRERLRWLFPLTLLPLLLYSMSERPEPPLKETVRKAAEEDPRFRIRSEGVESLDDLFRALEIDRLEGAFHSRFASAQWVYAGVAACGFWALILLIFPLGRANSLHLWTVGLLIGTGGILLLLALHQLPFVRAFYEAATGEAGFMTSFAGFTLGVGVCEELVKLLPLVIVLRRGGNLDVRGAVAWGLAMGAGFGVSEAVYYAAEMYNGMLPGAVYVVRFVSCVALHMAWSAAAAARLWREREDLEAAESAAGLVLPVALAAAGSVLLHGLYDVLLKFGADFGALCAAGLSFVYFFWSADRARAAELSSARPPAGA